MKKKIFYTAIIALFSLTATTVFYSCKKNPVDNFQLHISPAMFEYTALIKVIDAADSTVPANLSIVMSPENADFLYDIMGKKTLKFSSGGIIQVGLSPIIKPTEGNPVVIRFQLQGTNYITESYTLTFSLNVPSVSKTFTLMNKNNLPKGVSYTEVTTSITGGVIDQPLTISLGGGGGDNGFKNSANETDAPVNTVTLGAGTKFYYWEFDRTLDKYVKIAVTETGLIYVQAFFRQTFPGWFHYRAFPEGYIVNNGISNALEPNTAMFGMGGWEFIFKLNGKYVYQDTETPSTDFRTVANLGVPKYGYNLKTGNLYQIGDVIDIYNFRWGWDNAKYSLLFELVSTQTLSQTSTIDPNYFQLSPINLNSINNVWIGAVLPEVSFNTEPVIKVEGDPTPTSWENTSSHVLQYLRKEFLYNGSPVRYLFGDFQGYINTPYQYGWYNYVGIPGTYIKHVRYPKSKRINNVYTTFIDEEFDKIFNITSGSANPFDLTIPANQLEITSLDISIKCDNSVIRPSFYFMVGWRYPGHDATDESMFAYEGYVSNGRANSYLLRVGQSYKFYVQYEGTTYMRIDTIKTANTIIVIDNADVCKGINQ